MFCMKNLIIYLTFIPWYLYFQSACKNALKDLNKNKITKTWIKKNFMNIFHFDNLILFAIFTFFSKNYQNANQIWLVEILLFTVINLFLYLNRFYDKNNSKDKLEIKDISIALIILLLTLIPIVFYVSTRNYLVTYYVLFGYSFFNYVIVFISKLIYELLIKIIRRK